MLRSGDWVVPRLQESPVYFRPPLQNWAIALGGQVRGCVDEIAVRWPSVASVLLLGLLIYAYSRTCLGRVGALAAGAAFITMGQVLELGRLGESDPLMTLMVAASLLVWHYGRLRGWSPVWYWSAGYLLAALATLTKGAQGPVYFGMTVGGFLLWTGRWREAFRWSHLVGILVFVATMALWHVPYFFALGWDSTRRIYWDDLGMRFVGSPWLTIKHLVAYPVEVLGCLLPWAVLLIAYLRRDFRESLKSAREQAIFVAIAIVLAFPSCWLAPIGRSRYFMPLYPCFAVLIGMVVQRCCEADATQKWRKLWPVFLTILAGLMVGAGILIPIAATVRKDGLGQPAWFLVAYGVAAVALAATTWWASRGEGSARTTQGVLSVAAFLGLTWSGVVVNHLIHASEIQSVSVAELKHRLPPDVHLVSLGRIDHLFAYYYRDPIALLPRTREAEQAIAPGDYFCSGDDLSPPMEVSFPYEKIAVVSCDRWHAKRGNRVVLVGRRLPTPTEERTTEKSPPAGKIR
jgi:4-amino-4-deoxy-L-arabinose transferase-like glycosyltransferase